jgi:hypothetical protein
MMNDEVKITNNKSQITNKSQTDNKKNKHKTFRVFRVFRGLSLYGMINDEEKEANV